MNEQNELTMLEAVERYIRGEMNPDERLHFENLRKSNSEIDQMVVEHTLFLQQINRFGEWKKFRNTLHEVHTDLNEQGKIKADRLGSTAKVVYLWNRYKRVAGIAASIAGITALSFSSLVWSLSPKTDQQKITQLSRDIQQVKREQTAQKSMVNNLQNKMAVTDAPIDYKSGGSGFMIDPRGLLVTNAHVVKNAKHVAVQNKRGEIFKAKVAFIDAEKDIAILKIDDATFKMMQTIPYGISKSSTDLAEPIFTLGYPRDEIVYGQGYLSAKTGYDGDTLSCQISIDAYPGNSGGPIFNSRGEVIGVLSTRETSAENVVFALQAKHIYKAVDELKKDTSFKRVKLSTKSSIAGLEASAQVKKVQDYVFMVKVD